MTHPISITPGIVSPTPGITIYAAEQASLRVSAGNPPTRVVSASGLSIQVTGLVPANTYRFRVRAVDAAGNYSAWSDEVTAVTASYPAPAVVQATTTIGSPLIAGASPATVAGSATVGAPATGLVRTVTTAGTTGSVTGLLPARQYAATVRARDAAGNWSAFSAPFTFTTGGAGTVGPSTVAAVATISGPVVGGTPPTVTAGRARPVVNGGSVLLDVTAAPPGGEAIIGYAWTVQSGGGSLSNASTATPTYSPPGSGTGIAVIRAAVSATNAGRATADVTVGYGPSIVAAENTLTGTARATWDLVSPNFGGVSTLQGFADGFTADRGSTINFKIAQSDTAGWSAEVFRLGWYNGDGARSYGTITPTGGQVTASQAQPSPGDADPDTTLLSADCANWSTTLSWTPPVWAPSGMYLLRLNRTGGGASHILFVVRDDARTADLMLMPADSTWNAYNAWGGMGSAMYTGNSLYYGTAINQYNSDAARYVSYNRPVVNRGAADSGRTYGAVAWSTFFTGEYPMVRFVERNGIDVKYYGCIDAGGDSLGTHLTGNGTTRGSVKAAMFVGHNEYWSDVMRAGWERAKNLGVSVFSCASNEVFWRTVGASADSAGRPRIIECYKSTIAARSSTGRTQWTGTWRDPDGAGKGGNNPENTFTGTIFMVNGPDLRSLVVPFAGGYSAQPLWRSTTVAALTTGQSFTSPGQILGFEWDTYGPAGATSTGNAFLAAPHPRAVFCSTATYTITTLALTDAGDEYGAGDITHRLVVHPGGAGAMVFGTGTTNWALGVDDANTYQQGSDNTSVAIQQATLNMLTDMGAPPRTLMSGLTQPSPVDWFPDIPPATVAATVTIPVPGVAVGTGIVIAPSTVAATATVGSPAMRIGAGAAPGVVAATTTVPAPAQVSGSGLVTPVTVAGVTAVGAPSTGGTAATSPATAVGVTTIGAPTAQAGARATPTAVAGSATVPTPTAALAGTVTPGTVAASAGVGAVSTGGTAQTSPPTVAATTTVSAPSAQTGSGTAPATVGAVTTVPAPAVRLSVAAAPAAVAGAAAIPTPAVVTATAATTTPATVTATTTTPTATVTTGNAPAPPVVASVVVVAAPTLTTGSTATPGTVTGSTTAGGAAGSTTAAAPATVTATTTSGAPLVITGTGPSPATLAAQAAVAAVTILTSSRIGVTTVPAVTAVPAAVIALAARPTPAAVTGTTTVAAAVLKAAGTVTAGTITGSTIIGEISHIVGRVEASTQTATVTGVRLTATVTGDPLRAKVT